MSDEELANVSGGVLWFDDDAPDGHELTCIKLYYWGWSNYYYCNKICENCKSKNTHYENPQRLVCNDCGHKTHQYFEIGF